MNRGLKSTTLRGSLLARSTPCCDRSLARLRQAITTRRLSPRPFGKMDNTARQLSNTKPSVLQSIGLALPPNYYERETFSSVLWNQWSEKIEGCAPFERLHRPVRSRGCHLALPMDAHHGIDSFAEGKDKWIERAAELGEEAVLSALSCARLSPADIDHVFFTTVTGIASPGIDAQIVNRLSMRADVKRTLIFGPRCVGGAAGLARAADYLRGFPSHSALLVSVELCSLTVQLKDQAVAKAIASVLFAEGAAAAIVSGAERNSEPDKPRIVATRSIFFHDTGQMIGWHIGDTGFEIVLSAGVPPHLVRNNLRQAADSFLDEYGLSRRDIKHWILTLVGRKCCKPWSQRSRFYQTRPGAIVEIGGVHCKSVLRIGAVRGG